MGGSSSKQTATDTTNMMTDVVTSSTANCITAAGQNGNWIILAGNDNSISDLTQSVNIEINPGQKGCSFNSGFSSTLSGQIGSTLTGAANTSTNNASQALDWNSTTQSDSVTNNILTTYAITNTLNCLTSANGQNILVVEGSGNTVDDVKQQVAEKITTNCVYDSPTTLNTTYGVTSTINQSNKYSASVLGNLSDIFSAIFSKSGIVIVIAFVILVALAVMLKARAGKSAASDAASDAASGAASGAAPDAAPGAAPGAFVGAGW